MERDVRLHQLADELSWIATALRCDMPVKVSAIVATLERLRGLWDARCRAAEELGVPPVDRDLFDPPGLQAEIAAAIDRRQRAEASARLRPLLGVTHRTDGSFEPLLEFRRALRRGLAAIEDGRDPAMIIGPFQAARTLIEQGDDLPDHLAEDLYNAVADAFGARFSTAAARGRLRIVMADEDAEPVPPAGEPAEAAPAVADPPSAPLPDLVPSSRGEDEGEAPAQVALGSPGDRNREGGPEKAAVIVEPAPAAEGEPKALPAPPGPSAAEATGPPSLPHPERTPSPHDQPPSRDLAPIGIEDMEIGARTAGELQPVIREAEQPAAEGSGDFPGAGTPPIIAAPVVPAAARPADVGLLPDGAETAAPVATPGTGISPEVMPALPPAPEAEATAVAASEEPVDEAAASGESAGLSPDGAETAPPAATLATGFSPEAPPALRPASEADAAAVADLTEPVEEPTAPAERVGRSPDGAETGAPIATPATAFSLEATSMPPPASGAQAAAVADFAEPIGESAALSESVGRSLEDGETASPAATPATDFLPEAPPALPPAPEAEAAAVADLAEPLEEPTAPEESVGLSADEAEMASPVVTPAADFSPEAPPALPPAPDARAEAVVAWEEPIGEATMEKPDSPGAAPMEELGLSPAGTKVDSVIEATPVAETSADDTAAPPPPENQAAAAASSARLAGETAAEEPRPPTAEPAAEEALIAEAQPPPVPAEPPASVDSPLETPEGPAEPEPPVAATPAPPTIEVVETSVFPLFFGSFIGRANLLHASRRGLAAVRRELAAGLAPVEPLEALHDDLGLRREAVLLLDAWERIKLRGERDTPVGLQTLFELLGCQSPTVYHYQAPARHAVDSIVAFQCAPINDRDIVMVPAFGSRAQGRYRIVLAWEQLSFQHMLRRIASSIAEADSPMIILCFRNIDRAERLALARHAATSPATSGIAVIDELVLLFLAQFRGNRLKALFDCILPFTALDPYLRAGDEVPSEIFLGHARERASLFDGTAPPVRLVCGGRQVGKTALLRRLAADQAADPRFGAGLYVDLAPGGRSRSPDELFGMVSDGLRERHLPVPLTNAASQLERGLGDWLNEPRGGGRRRVLIAFDNADAFLRADAAAAWARMRELKTLIQRLAGLLSIVIAGGREVQRLSRDRQFPLADVAAVSRLTLGQASADRQEAARLVHQPMATLGYRLVEPAALELLLRRVAGDPGLLMAACETVLAQARRRALEDPQFPLPFTISADDVARACDTLDLPARIAAKLQLTLDLDAGFGEIYRAVAAAGGRGLTPADIALRVRQDAVAEPGGSPDPAIAGGIAELTDYGVLREVEPGHFSLSDMIAAAEELGRRAA